MRRKISLAAAAFAMGLLVLDSRQAVQSATQGVEICVRTVIPSLFPFFLLSIFLTGSLTPGRWLRPLIRLFGIAPGCGGILITGLLGGYPVGAQAAAEGWRRGQISKAQAQRLLSFCSQAGPSFLFGMAAAQFPQGKYGWMLWGVQLFSAWTVAQLSQAREATLGELSASGFVSLAGAMQKAIGAMASVCGWVVLFRVVIGFCQRWFLWLFPQLGQILFCGLLEITNGCLMLSQIENIALRFWVAVLLLNWGGLCVAMQTASVAEGLNMGAYLRGKALQTLCALCYGGALLGNWLCLMAPAGIFLVRTFRKGAKSSSICVAVGV